MTRLTLKPDEAPQPKRWQNSDHLDRAGLEAMSRRAEEKAKEENNWTRKRKADGKENPDSNKKSKKKIRKLKYHKVVDDWGMIGNEIQDMEEREIARTRFLWVDRSWAKVGTTHTQTKIRVWSELEIMARNIITSCLKQAQTEAEKRIEENAKIIDGETYSWLQSKEAEEEFATIPDGWRLKKQINLPEFNLEKKIEDVPEGWKFRFKQPKIQQFFKSRELIDFDKEMD